MSYIDIIKQQLASDSWQDWELAQQIYTPNRRHAVTQVKIPNVAQELILKSYTIPPAFKFTRKLELLWHMYLDCYACRAYYMAIALRAANLPTFTPVASWQTGHGFLRRSFLLMEKLAGSQTLKDYLIEHMQQSDCDELSDPSILLLEKAGYLIRCLHQNGFWHSDLTLNNFLVKESLAADKTPELYIMDLESIKPNKRAKVIEDTNILIKTCLKRIELKHNCLEPLLAGYLVGPPPTKQLDEAGVSPAGGGDIFKLPF